MLQLLCNSFVTLVQRCRLKPIKMIKFPIPSGVASWIFGWHWDARTLFEIGQIHVAAYKFVHGITRRLKIPTLIAADTQRRHQLQHQHPNAFAPDWQKPHIEMRALATPPEYVARVDLWRGRTAMPDPLGRRYICKVHRAASALARPCPRPNTHRQSSDYSALGHLNK